MVERNPTNFLPDHAHFFEELYADSDSEDDEFDFELFHATETNTNHLNFDLDSWVEGDREPYPFYFTGNSGLNVPIHENPSLLDFFELFIKDEDYEQMSNQTNLYAFQFLLQNEGQLPPNSRFRKWQNTTPSEMKLFIAMIIAMGLVSQLELSEYWTSDPVTSTPFFPSCMSRNRFQLLLSFFHLCNNEQTVRRGAPGYDPLFKLGEIYKRVIGRFSTTYVPHQQLSFDEGMIPWRGNLSFRVYNPSKPIKYGIKAYMLCDGVNGYCSKFSLYTGKNKDGPSEAGATYDLVMNMLRGYYGQGFMLYCDNYYTSPHLFWDLWNLDSFNQENTDNSNGSGGVIRQQIMIQRIKNEAQKLQEDITQQFSQELDALFETFLSEVEQIEKGNGQNDNYGIIPKNSKRKDIGEVPDKVFVNRRSVLTDLFEISHVKTIFHIFVAILIVFSLNTIVYDIINEGRLNLDFDLMQCALGKFPKVMALWVCMQLSTLIVVYPTFYYWATTRQPGRVRWLDWIALALYVAYQVAFLVLPVKYVKEHTLPSASACIITTEQVRLIMKVHAFVRENAGRVLSYQNSKKDDSMNGDELLCPDFSKYLYFLFCPTLIYRDSYPRTPTIRWNYVVSNFVQVTGCLFYTYYIFERFLVPVFHHFNDEHVTPKRLLLSVFGSMLPGTMVLLIGFFGILHSWLNAFAEMLRFGDRMFYKDWWNSTSFGNFYRTWNIVVHDWLYTYVYKDFYKLLGPKNRVGAMTMVFLISAVFHEYILTLSFNFFYPVLFVMFMGAGFGFIFLKGRSRSWNVLLWVALFIGSGLLMCLYSMEWYARRNCPVTTDNFLDYLIPRSWTCNIKL